MRIRLLVLGVMALSCFACRAGQAQDKKNDGKRSLRAREVSFTGGGGVILAGTLTLPRTAPGKPAPGLVLIAGSGPTDRDGNQMPSVQTNLLRQIAERLAAQGVACLRFDKRVTGANRAHLPHDTGALGDFCSWENFVDDSIAALRCLQQQPEIDATRTGFLGHSEGGLLALAAANKIKGGPHPAFVLVLASTPGRPLGDVIHDQLVRLLKQQGATDEQTAYFLDKNTEIVSALHREPLVPGNVPPGLAALYPPYLGRFLHSEFILSPADLAHQFVGPTLILQGEKDVQILAAKDAVRLDAALHLRAKDVHTLALIPGASHNFKAVTSDADPGFEGPVKEEALNVLTRWLKSHLLGNEPR